MSNPFDGTNTQPTEKQSVNALFAPVNDSDKNNLPDTIKSYQSSFGQSGTLESTSPSQPPMFGLTKSENFQPTFNFDGPKGSDTIHKDPINLFGTKSGIGETNKPFTDSSNTFGNGSTNNSYYSTSTPTTSGFNIFTGTTNPPIKTHNDNEKPTITINETSTFSLTGGTNPLDTKRKSTDTTPSTFGSSLTNFGTKENINQIPEQKDIVPKQEQKDINKKETTSQQEQTSSLDKEVEDKYKLCVSDPNELKQFIEENKNFMEGQVDDLKSKCEELQQSMEDSFKCLNKAKSSIRECKNDLATIDTFYDSIIKQEDEFETLLKSIEDKLENQKSGKDRSNGESIMKEIQDKIKQLEGSIKELDTHLSKSCSKEKGSRLSEVIEKIGRNEKMLDALE
ncbi:hypothetical protein QTN25_000969 [Entamoeba marina]